MLSDELETRHNNMNSNIKVTSFVPKYAFKNNHIYQREYDLLETIKKKNWVR